MLLQKWTTERAPGGRDDNFSGSSCCAIVAHQARNAKAEVGLANLITDNGLERVSGSETGFINPSARSTTKCKDHEIARRLP
jgi:hypothetical protein